ncbi:hypothetical protein [Amycolatopsis sp. DG1A-15b]|uniref:hypothetical protein n=1 Tax=Amycolatopsis sp. DG1A-15b TaxID=3052846 RepID=UPI00255C1DA5|nr:hypothetical protein [Amycolatopsis sp. DG1A-15b]WIX93006.1 hypothetical protein QRY02_22230 [Amycolatopsis sp. DG1A-15b]
MITEGDAIGPPRRQRRLGANSVSVPFDHDFPVARPDTFGEAMLRAVDEIQG